MANMANKRIVLFFLTSILAILVLFSSRQGLAGTSDNISGWAWAENIGWISFNNTTGSGTVNYGVNINPSTRILSGYAWSENIGWITFNESELAGCPTSPCQAKLDVSTKQISGWARALAYGGGWDGWIRLRDTSYGVWIDTSKSPAEFRNWAWSDMNIGWTSFNCQDRSICPTSNYKVTTTFSFNQPPVANFSCSPANCTVYTGQVLTLNNSSSDPDNNLVRSEWDILGWGSSPDLTCCASGCNSTNILCNYTVQSLILGNGTFNANLTVKDALNATGTLTKAFNIKQDAVADFVCSLDNSTWASCHNFQARTNQIVYFLDQSSPSEGAVITSWAWNFQNATPSVAYISNPQSSFNSSGIKTVSLTIGDSASRSASKSYNLRIGMLLPEWEEIIPIAFKGVMSKLVNIISFWR